jgi:hypothetical protein
MLFFSVQKVFLVFQNVQALVTEKTILGVIASFLNNNENNNKRLTK